MKKNTHIVDTKAVDRLRDQAGLTYHEIARRAGLSYTHLSRTLANGRPVRERTADKLAEVLGVPTRSILAAPPPPPAAVLTEDELELVAMIRALPYKERRRIEVQIIESIERDRK